MLYNIDLYKSMSDIRKFTEGNIIYHENDVKGDTMFLLLSGRVGMFTGYLESNENRLGTVSAGSFFGEMTLFLGKKRTTTAVALSEVVALEISPATILEFIRREPEAVLALLKSFAIRLDYLNASDNWKTAEPPALETEALNHNAGKENQIQPLPEPIETPKEPTAPATTAATLQTGSNSIPASSVFLSGHKTYRLPLDQANTKYIYPKNIVCPVCDQAFQVYAVRRSRLLAERTEIDLRIRYQGVEPMYYDVITCPRCWYSALAEVFKEAGSSRRQLIEQIMLPYRAELGLQFGLVQDTTTLFTGYYLALQCIPICFPGQHLQTGKLWIKLSRLYDDCGDETMRAYAAQQALTAYKKAYTEQHIPAKQVQQLCYIIGELSYYFHQITDARKFFFLAKTDKEGVAMIRRFAEDRLEDIKQEEKRQEKD